MATYNLPNSNENDTVLKTKVTVIDPNSFEPQQFQSSDDAIIPSFDIKGLFNPNSDTIEFYGYSLDNNLITADYNFRNWATYNDVSFNVTGAIETLHIDPTEDCIEYGISSGTTNVVYNFISNKFNSSTNNKYYISDLSSDRTELKINNNYIDSGLISSSFSDFNIEVLNSEYFDEFYLNFGDNNYIIGVNAQLDSGSSGYGILIKLYEPLPTEYDLKSQLWVCTKVGESLGYSVKFQEPIFTLDEVAYLAGPNTNLNIKNEINNSTEYKTYEELIYSSVSSSYDQFQNILYQKGIKIEVDYTNFNDFVFLSSAKQRLENFDYKVGKIEQYNNDIQLISSSTGSVGFIALTPNYSESLATLETKKRNIIKNFCGYEYYLYFHSGSKAWPKSNTSPPFTLYSTGSTQALTWLGSDIVGSAYFGGMIESSSNYDNANQNNLLFSIPEYVRNDSDNENYDLFVGMMGKYFDDLWLYTKDITEKLNADNRLNYGVNKDLVADVLRSLGTNIYQNNLSIENLYSAFLGSTPTGNLNPPTGSEYITTYITASNGPISLDDTNKEIYKRLYSNLPHLLKKKGTTAGLRDLITLYGIPSTILRISEFGGKDKINNDDWDLWYDRYSYAFNTYESASVFVPWKPLSNSTLNSGSGYVSFGYWTPLYTDSGSADTIEGYSLPNTIEFRFKTDGLPNVNSRRSQSLFVVKNAASGGLDTSFNFGAFLEYSGDGLASGSYSGSAVDPNYQYGNLYLVASQSNGVYISSSKISLPFYNGDWWSVMINRNKNTPIANYNTYEIISKDKIYNGWDGDQLGFQGSSSLQTTDGTFWKYHVSESNHRNGFYLGGYISGSSAGINVLSQADQIFSGSFQELRFYRDVLLQERFNDYVMNPESIEGNSISGVSSSFNTLGFRAPLGNELNVNITSSTTSYHTASLISDHPAVTASAESLIIPSFVTDVSASMPSSSNYYIIYEDGNRTGSYTPSQTEIYYLDPPVVGIKNRVTEKIIIEGEKNFGNVLSKEISIQQNYPASQSYIRALNQLEVAFSPQNEVNDDIVQSLGYFDVGKYIGDPRFMSSSDTSYPNLNDLAKEYFQKYYKNYQWYDYVRLIKYFDNSLFKLIKDYVPARTSLSTGVVIKQHLLERNRYRPPQVSYTKYEYSGSINMVSITGSTAGSLTQYNTASYTTEGIPGRVGVTQSFSQSVMTPSGSIASINPYQLEFYDGEFSGSNKIVTTQSLNPGNTYKYTASGSMNVDSGSVNVPFDLSDYVVLSNNATFDRQNRNYVDVDYASAQELSELNFQYMITQSGVYYLPGDIPTYTVPYSRLTSSLSRTQESNYTSRKVIYPRYSGSKVSSLDYNFYTPSGSYTSSFSKDIIPWIGDQSIGKVAAIDKHPKYFAHFKKIYFNLGSQNYLDVVIDYLIPADVEADSISTISTIPGLIQVKGTGNNQYLTSNNFEKFRKCAFNLDTNDYVVGYTGSQPPLSLLSGPTYGAPTTPFIGPLSASFTEVNWETIDNQIYTIAQGGNHYITLASSVKKNPPFHCSLTSSIKSERLFFIPPNLDAPTSLLEASIWWETLSHNLATYGCKTTGVWTLFTSSVGGLQSNKVWVGNNNTNSPPFTNLGKIFADNNENYGRYDFDPVKDPNKFTYQRFDISFTSSYDSSVDGIDKGTNSTSLGFENIKTPWIPKTGDELLILATVSESSANESFEWFTFTVTSGYNSANPQPSQCINVSPDPTGVNSANYRLTNMPKDGYFIYRRRQDKDNIVRLTIPEIAGIKGWDTPFNKKGYLIPDDFSSTQKENVAKMITVLNQNQVFG